MQEYWIEGYFYVWWSKRSWRCEERDIFIPRWAIRNPPGIDQIFQGKFYINDRFVEQQAEAMQLYIEGKNQMSQREFYYTKRFLDNINKPLELEVSEEEFGPPPTALP